MGKYVNSKTMLAVGLFDKDTKKQEIPTKQAFVHCLSVMVRTSTERPFATPLASGNGYHKKQVN